jgi:hypothetical protein
MTPRALIGSAATCAAVSLAVVVAAAGLVLVGGLQREVRDILGFQFGGTGDSTLGVAAHNARIAVATLLGAAAVSRSAGRTRVLIEAALATVFAVNAASIGIAIGAYGSAAIAALALHAPVEFAAFSLAGGALLQARRQSIATRALVLVAAGCAALLVVAAALETSVGIAGLR